MNIDTTGIQELMLQFFKMIAELDFKSLNLDFMGELLTKIAPIWNPIWAAVNEWLNAIFGF